jgi:hypothetical protein
MSHFVWTALLCLFVFRPATARIPVPDNVPVPSYTDMYNAIVGLTVDGSEGYTVSTVLQREAAIFNLEGGTLALTKPLFGSVRALVYSGPGTFEYEPPVDVEKEQLARFYGTPSLRKKITGVVMFFSDTTIAEMKPDMKKGGGEAGMNTLTGLLRNAVQYIHDSKSQWVQSGIAQSFLENANNGMFYAHIECEDGPFFYAIDPYEVEEISLLRLAKRTRLGTFAHDVINSFHTEAEYMSGLNPVEDKAVVSIDKYTVDCSLSTSMDMTATTTVQFTGIKDGNYWIPFSLYHDLKVTSAKWGDGTPATFFKGEENPILWIRMDKPIKKGEKYTLNLAYNGGIINRYRDWLVLWSSIGWYPLHSGLQLQRSLFDVTFHYPSRYTLVAVGDNVSTSEDTQKEITTSRWVTNEPIRNYSFNIGKFKQTEFDDDERIPPLTILMNEGARSGSKMELQVGQDIANSIAFFQQLYGPLPVKKFFATEIPRGHGEAFPGLIHLSWATFERTDESGSDEMFRAHEVAHQWWGIGVDFQTYHDQWLSEAFAEYSGLMYMQLIRKDNDLFFKKLNDWRDKIAGNRKSLFTTGTEAGPIWLGQRTNTSTTAGDYGLIIYSKGAWVLHMLRNILIDIKGMKEDRFFALMKDFYTKYQGQRASTEDFRAVVEKHVGMDMSWFFDQWVYGTAIPKYTYATKTEKQGDGSYKVTMRVKQEHVPAGFQMPIPLEVNFGDNKLVRLRIMVSKPEEEIVLPMLPLEPEKITFNVFSSVLCEVEEGKW